MMLIQYETENHLFEIMRETNGRVERTSHPAGEFKYLLPDDGAIESLLSMAKQAPNQFHVVPNPKPRARIAWGRLGY